VRINIEDRALRDPNINRRLPRFTGLSRFDAFGRLLHVWGLAYDQRSAFALIEDVDDRAEHEGFAMAMVQAELAELTSETTIRMRGVEERIEYLVSAAESGQKGGATRAKQAAAGGRGAGGKFTKGSTTRPLVDCQGSSKGHPTAPLDADHTSSSGSAPSPVPDQAPLSRPTGARDPSTPVLATGTAPQVQSVAAAPPPIGHYVTLAVELLNAARTEVDPNHRPVVADLAFDYDLGAHLRRLPEAEREPAIRHGIAAIAEAVRIGKEEIGALRTGELAGPRSWAKWQAAPTTSRPPRARGDPPGARPPPRRHTAAAELRDLAIDPPDPGDP
jgi:hypothetical protein